MRQIFWQVIDESDGDLQGMIFFQDRDWPDPNYMERGWNLTWWDDVDSDYQNLHLPRNWHLICLGQ